MPPEHTQQADIDEWVHRFDDTQRRLNDLKQAVVGDLTRAIKARDGFSDKLHGEVRARIKSTTSFREKLQRKSYPNPLTDMHDLLGVRIVCLYPSVLGEVDELINATFMVNHREDKSAAVDPEMWRYSSVHYDCRLPATHSGSAYDHVKDIDFEIQVRTILQDAWASVEHKLGYKNEQSIPVKLRREFSALAGLFHIADQSFQHIADDIAKSERQAENTVVDGSATVINRGTLRALLRKVYPDMERAKPFRYSELVQDLGHAGILTLDALRDRLGSVQPALDPAGFPTDVDYARAIVFHPGGPSAT